MSWFKKTVNAHDMGSALWQHCTDLAQDFHNNLKPKLMAEGFISNPEQESAFITECILIHFWIIWRTVRERTVQDSLNAFLNDHDRTQNQGRAWQALENRFELYNGAMTKEREMRARGEEIWGPPPFMDAAMRGILHGGGTGKEPSMTVWLEIDAMLTGAFKSVRELRAKFNVR